jgi:hypothetical protein
MAPTATLTDHYSGIPPQQEVTHSSYNPQQQSIESTTADLIAGIFFGIAAALLVIALPLALCNYCHAQRRQRSADAQLEI